MRVSLLLSEKIRDYYNMELEDRIIDYIMANRGEYPKLINIIGRLEQSLKVDFLRLSTNLMYGRDYTLEHQIAIDMQEYDFRNMSSDIRNQVVKTEDHRLIFMFMLIIRAEAFLYLNTRDMDKTLKELVNCVGYKKTKW